MAAPAITADTPMGAILAAYPTAKTVLFARFHIGGCTSCRYEPHQTLAQVRAQHQVAASVDDMLDAIAQSAAIEATLRIDGAALRTALDGASPPRLLDARSKAEFDWSRLPGTQLITPELTFAALDEWPKATPIVVYSNHGERSLQKAAHFACYGMTAARSLDGGLKLWLDAGGPVEEGGPRGSAGATPQAERSGPPTADPNESPAARAARG